MELEGCGMNIQRDLARVLLGTMLVGYAGNVCRMNIAHAQFGDLTKRAGLKDALQVGTGKTVDLTGRPGGYLDNPAIKIGLPGNVKALDMGIRAAGEGPKLEAFEDSMNHAAESAAPAARQIFINAITKMSFEDARKLLNGGDTSITDYFKAKTTGDLKTAFRPAVEQAMASNGVTTQYDALTAKTSSVPFLKSQSLNIDDYVISKALDGLSTFSRSKRKRFAPTLRPALHRF